MKIILAVVTSINGKITRGSDPDVHSWTSGEDAKYFSNVIKENNLIVMGSKTYKAAREKMNHEPGKLRIVLTKNPEKYSKEAIPNILEFTSKSVREILENLTSRGFKQLLLTGGSEINGLFLTENVVDELWITIEPQLFGEGRPLFEAPGVDLTLKLQSSTQLNDQGTILLKYKVLDTSGVY
ncbi:hypothetical protein A3D80_02435 [Candidatus Roizmanbacteria bacterium RIFCSPHIGHO2_02_FULL_40_13b]|uniref:Bacterial bifunctional deaminase-reductase C-terminal domain-containing protein n=1 Tax=Candidatus Roizmanbacteria bacterium RIFCSPHIGHO2_01_FULL_39_24 TaxID=1802032 RepID=A0A1F7GIL2_9BACT|nr:MAG: hypothetical protein A2799_01925 [Candidatus Roizmanbacteria bacterium RIFCSPHIGHO2_01_FULL_39_24]OGK26498.1 MAG: hypothetical protein A3D80_02435 [Candidatus Roizmanbacteria bacterium RIFCSPHIGHO2_02_FULL_40_13b]OGK50348.1 MAG: hypothetical protein A3A56_00200 [Candidatus Roizmanbacteria bacterium RIFCSPLOWO2_01_FULL_40_32]OGK56193.1 MAG: hypothetical protein A3H83_01590 [Candidatus Roizmanbacteria bacterium RIFCSPLOWO2_02_FULL_39_8]